MKKITFLLILLCSTLSFGQISINEIDPDQSGTDAAEFIELLSSTPNLSLNGYIIVLYNGSNDQSYATYDLDGFSTDANGLFVLGNTGVNGASITLPSNALQNGADAVAIYQAAVADFPNNTPVTATNLIDAIVYGTNDADATGLLTTLGETTQYNDTINDSLQLNDAGTEYVAAPPTPGAANSVNAPSLTIDSPSNNFSFSSGTTSVDIEFTEANFTLGGSNVVEYIVNSGTPMATTMSPIAVAVTDGESYTVTLELKDTGGSLTPQVLRSVTFSVDDPPLALPVIEQFDYTVGQSLGDQVNWTDNNSGDDILIESGNLSYPGLDTDVGNSISFVGSGMDPSIDFTETTTGSVYASFLFRVTDVTDFNNADGGYFAVLRSASGSFESRVWIKPSTTTDDFVIGIGTGGSATEFTTETFAVNTDIFIVFNYDLSSGTVNIWVNPDVGIAEPISTLSETEATAAASIAGFLIRQDSGSETPSIVMDELKVGTNWTDVTAQTLSIAQFDDKEQSLNIYPNPVYDGVVNFPALEKDNAEIKVFNILGAEVASKRLNNSTSLNVSNLTPGVYLVQLLENNKRVTTTKLIVR